MGRGGGRGALHRPSLTTNECSPKYSLPACIEVSFLYHAVDQAVQRIISGSSESAKHPNEVMPMASTVTNRATLTGLGVG